MTGLPVVEKPGGGSRSVDRPHRLRLRRHGPIGGGSNRKVGMAQAQKRRPASNWAPVEAPPPKPPTFVDRLIDAITRHRSALRRLGIAASVIIIAGALDDLCAHARPHRSEQVQGGDRRDERQSVHALLRLHRVELPRAHRL